MAVGRSITLGDHELTRIGLGTNRLTDTPQHRDFIRAAVEAGIQMIDTAHVYTGGESERTIGSALADTPGEAVVATKGGYHPGTGKPEALRAQLEQSFESLGTETIDLYYLHRVDPETPLEDSLELLKEYRDAGRIQHVGLSDVGVAEIERGRTVLPIAVVQNPYNLSDRRYDDVIDFCESEGIVFVPYHPLHGDRGATPNRVKLAWLLRRSPATLPIPGTLSLDHLRENLGALELELSDSDYETLARDSA
jgi:pyridoxine 4-dehydrogenase